MSANHPAATESEAFLADVLSGLAEAPYTLPSKYLYDRPGSELFDRICELEAYYPTRTELGILGENAEAIAAAVGPRARVVELGSGSSNKTQALLDHLHEPAAYVPVDISGEHLAAAAERIAALYPRLDVYPVTADYTQPFPLPETAVPTDTTLVYFPGSTLGNFDVPDARAFLARQAELAGPGGGLVIGVDLVKDREILLRAYDDPEGVTAAFNRNLLTRLQRELGAVLDAEAFRHRALFNEELSCVEMHLESLRDQTMTVGGHTITLAAGQTIRTERSYKYTLAGFRQLAEEAGFAVECTWTDVRDWFSVHLLRVASA
ncbi:MAG TPA: L-histidine N(alpha)-methyltransferase [Gammaproteobacteria bacterium]|nr:L-histidine N(alpha)-methyltransferase [Gammaproteobacteria bacterium]